MRGNQLLTPRVHGRRVQVGRTQNIHRRAQGSSSDSSYGKTRSVRRRGLLYTTKMTCFTADGNGREKGARRQCITLPAKCREAALAIAHEIPLGEHLGKTKTAHRLLRRFQIIWTDACVSAYEELKRRLVTSPVLKSSDHLSCKKTLPIEESAQY